MNNPSPRCSGIFIPIEIYEREDLSFFEIHLLSWIDLLYCKKHRGCFASNEYLASKLRNAQINTVAKGLTSLRQKGLIEDVSFDGRKRVIRALINRSVDTAQSKSALDLNPTLDSSIGFLSNPELEENPSYPYTEKKEEKKREESASPPTGFSVPKEEKKERALHVSTTQEEHNRLVNEYGEEQVKKFYARLSEWKQDTPKAKWKKNDYRSVLRWVVEAEKENKGKKVDGNDVGENSEVIKKLFKKFQSRMDIVFGADYIEFLNGPTSNHIRVDDKNFKDKVRLELKKRKLIKED